MPSAVLVGETVTLECSWDLEVEETLYSVKWYRGREEFYRYIPKELPHTRVFPQRGIDVDVSIICYSSGTITLNNFHVNIKQKTLRLKVYVNVEMSLYIIKEHKNVQHKIVLTYSFPFIDL